MESFANKDFCPRCREARLRTWNELADEQQFLVERLPASADYTQEERKKHRFCPRCWFEETERNAREV